MRADGTSYYFCHKKFPLTSAATRHETDEDASTTAKGGASERPSMGPTLLILAAAAGALIASLIAKAILSR